MSTLLVPSHWIAASTLLIGLSLPTVASAGPADAPVPCSQAPSGCPRSMSGDAWGSSFGNGEGSDLGRGARTTGVGGGYAVATHIGGREREIDQVASMYLQGEDLRTGEKFVYAYTGDVFDRRYGSMQAGYDTVLTHVEYLPLSPIAREIVEADVNADGKLDLVVGDPGGSCGSGGTGRVLVYFDISDVHDARYPEATVCGLPGQSVGGEVNTNRVTGPGGNATVVVGNTWYRLEGIGFDTFSWVDDYASWTTP